MMARCIDDQDIASREHLTVQAVVCVEWHSKLALPFVNLKIED